MFSFLKVNISDYFLLKMLHERTSSAINLRMESGRRHAIRNLKAKVRALLPPDTCPRDRKRKHKSEKLDLGTYSRHERFEDHQHFQPGEKKRNKIFEKLTRKEIQEINQNKHYFLDNEESIAFYQSYVRDSYPELVEHEWTAPHAQKKDLMPFAFIPTSLINPSELTYKKLVSEKRLLEKRNSGSKSLGILRRTSIPLIEPQFQPTESRVNKGKAEACLARKQAMEEQEKVKREINSVHLQRSQHQADAKRQRILKQKLQSAKVRFSSSHFGKYDQRKWSGQGWIESDITALASKLRRVCLHRKKESLGEPPML